MRALLSQLSQIGWAKPAPPNIYFSFRIIVGLHPSAQPTSLRKDFIDLHECGRLEKKLQTKGCSPLYFLFSHQPRFSNLNHD